jgi:hypothetical protein
MAKYCPITKKKVLYLTCLECEDKICEESSENSNATMPIQKRCHACGEVFTIMVNKEGYELWMSGKTHIQNALPNLSDDDRELLLSGVCGKCFDKMFDEET